jgi:1-acyl-sn-glycerol-3-phosphate acyltransferase
VSLRDILQIAWFLLFVRPFLTLFLGLRVRGREFLPAGDPFILVANHTSHLDTVSLLGLFPLRRLRAIQPVGAADYFGRGPWTSVFARTLFNVLLIERKHITADNDPVRAMETALRAGKSLIVFPEGTRGTGQELQAFHTGVARVLLRLPEVPVVPAFLLNTGRSLPKGEWIPVPFFCEVRLGRARLLSGAKEEIVEALRRAVLELAEDNNRS